VIIAKAQKFLQLVLKVYQHCEVSTPFLKDDSVIISFGLSYQFIFAQSIQLSCFNYLIVGSESAG
jgi:hypothetical protein